MATVRFVYTTSGTGTLLLAAMPHHLARLVSPVTTTLTYSTLSGTLQGVEGSTWTMSLPLSTIGFEAPRPVAPAYLPAVRAALAADASFVPDPSAVDVDPYFGGKQMAKLARLAVIADELGETRDRGHAPCAPAPLVAAWLDGTNGNPFVYDTTWGGVVTTRGLAEPVRRVRRRPLQRPPLPLRILPLRRRRPGPVRPGLRGDPPRRRCSRWSATSPTPARPIRASRASATWTSSGATPGRPGSPSSATARTRSRPRRP